MAGCYHASSGSLGMQHKAVAAFGRSASCRGRILQLHRTATQSRVCGWRGLGLPSGCYPCFGLQARRMHQEGRTRKDMRTTHATARSKHQAARGAPPSLVLPRSDPELFDFCMREKTESTLPHAPVPPSCRPDMQNTPYTSNSLHSRFGRCHSQTLS